MESHLAELNNIYINYSNVLPIMEQYPASYIIEKIKQRNLDTTILCNCFEALYQNTNPPSGSSYCDYLSTIGPHILRWSEPKNGRRLIIGQTYDPDSLADNPSKIRLIKSIYTLKILPESDDAHKDFGEMMVRIRENGTIAGHHMLNDDPVPGNFREWTDLIVDTFVQQ